MQGRKIMRRRFTKTDGSLWSLDERSALTLELLTTVTTEDGSRTITIENVTDQQVQEVLEHNNFTSEEAPIRRYY